MLLSLGFEGYHQAQPGEGQPRRWSGYAVRLGRPPWRRGPGSWASRRGLPSSPPSMDLGPRWGLCPFKVTDSTRNLYKRQCAISGDGGSVLRPPVSCIQPGGPRGASQSVSVGLEGQAWPLGPACLLALGWPEEEGHRVWQQEQA